MKKDNGKPINLIGSFENLKGMPPIYDAERQDPSAHAKASYIRGKKNRGLSVDGADGQWYSIYETTKARWSRQKAKVSVGADGSVDVNVDNQNASAGDNGSIPAHQPSDALLLEDINAGVSKQWIESNAVIQTEGLKALPYIIKNLGDQSNRFIELFSDKMVAADAAKDSQIERLSKENERLSKEVERLVGIMARSISEVDLISMERLKAFKQLLADVKEGKLSMKDESTMGKIMQFGKDIAPLLEAAGPYALPVIQKIAGSLGLPLKAGE